MGLPYGINNKSGKPSKQEAFRILDRASEELINLLDSAEEYGDALKVISAYLKQRKNSPLKVISKFIADGEPLKRKADRTRLALGGRILYAYMFHRFADYESGLYLKELLALKHEGVIDRIGVSVYREAELEMCLNDPDINVIQVPLNPFDASDRKLELFKKAKAHKKEIHVRSVFLQGLFFKTPDQLSGNLMGLRPVLTRFREVLNSQGLDIRQACLNFALHQPAVDRVLIGVETAAQLEQNVTAVVEDFPASLMEMLRSGPRIDRQLLNPSTWKP